MKPVRAMAGRLRGRLARTLVLTGIALVALPVSSALAGNIYLTGHDMDFHCSYGQTPECEYFRIVVNLVRSGAPDPTKPVLVLDKPAGCECNSGEVTRALDNTNTFGTGWSAAHAVVVDPSSAAFATTVMTTATFSAIIIASDYSCGGCDLNPNYTTGDSDAINARKADIQAFFNSGGGLIYLSGANNGSSGTGVYYQSVPVPAGGEPVSPPFTLTSDGAALGITDDRSSGESSSMINCCATHNSFTLPSSGSALKVAETDSGGFAESLFATGASIGANGFTGSTTTSPGPGAPQNENFPGKNFFTKPQQGVLGTGSGGVFGGGGPGSFNNPNVQFDPKTGDLTTTFIGPPGDYTETDTYPAPPNHPGGESTTNGVMARAARRHVYGTGSTHTTQTGPVTLTVHPTAAARAALHSHRKLRVAVHLAFRSSAHLGNSTATKDFKVKVKGGKH